MDERTEILVCAAASVASNCVPCFEHYYKRACTAGISSDTIEEVVELARKVQNGAHVAVRARTDSLLNACKDEDPGCCSGPASSDGSCIY
jgi:alkylhydroperoxidase/carboxymuconolactone decarboxylase family protein YurZ